MPLTPTNNGAGTTAAGQRDQPELPAWLESLRAHERPISSGSGNQPFSMAELEDGNSVPNWMRRDQQGAPDSGMSDAFPALSSATPPDIDSVEQQGFNAQGLNAGSLIDEQSLPSWMRTNRESGPTGAIQNVSANSLVQPDALPAWMQELSQTPPPQPNRPRGEEQYGMPPTPVTPPLSNDMASMPRTPPISASYGEIARGMGAGGPVENQMAPPWMMNAQGPGQQSQNSSVPPKQGFSANDLIEQQSLPAWMRQLQGQDNSDPVSAMGVPVSGSGQGTGQEFGGGVGMPAANLLDMNSLPSWMNEAEQNRANSSYNQGTQPGGMSAGSLLDANALPGWLRNADNPVQQGGGMRGPQPPMRPVPSRPRGEIAPQEQSEMAANVFTSMLGVSASAPQYPGQGSAVYNNLGVAQVPPSQPFPQSQPTTPPGFPGWQSPQSGQNIQPPQSWQISGSMPMVSGGGVSSPMPGGLPLTSGQRDSSGKIQTQSSGAQNAGQTGAAWPDASTPGYSSTANPHGKGNRDSQAGVTKKKSFFDSIRDFFFK